MMHVPDWRDTNAYPGEEAYKEPEKLADDPLHTSKSWAWQFLRRNSEYQADYNNWWRQKNQRNSGPIAKKYGMLMLLPYEMENPPAIPFINTLSLRSLEREISLGETPELEAFHIPLVFDVRFPLEDQLSLARIQIEEKINKSSPLKALADDLTARRKRTNVYGRYLRIIDARSNGVTFDVIADQFSSEGLYHPNEENGYSCKANAERDYFRARELMRSGYLGIAYS